jgi:hypothetical protein
MLDRHEVTEYYSHDSKPAVYRVTMRNRGNLSHPLDNGSSFEFSAFKLDQSSTQARVNNASTETSWIFPYIGTALVPEDPKLTLGPEDLVLMRPNASAEFVLPKNEDLFRAFLITLRNPNPQVVTSDKRDLFALLPHRTDKIVDWVGNWVDGAADTTLHIAREGEKTRRDDSYPAEDQLHYHKETIEVYAAGTGRTIIRVDLGKGVEKIPLGPSDVIVIMPGIPHGMGSIKANKSYSGIYQGITVKMPSHLNIPVDRNDKFAYNS